MKRILLVEDDPDLSEGLVEALTLEGYEPVAATDGAVGLEQARGGGWDLLIVDVMLPGLSGFQLVRKLRRKDSATPVLMLTARGQEMDKVRGLKLGADDYLTKPFGMAELFARIEALLRRSSGAGSSRVLEVGDFRADFAARRAWLRTREVELTPREFQILELLFDRRGEAVSRSALLTHIWGLPDDVDVTTRAIDQHVAMLRRKIEPAPAEPRIVETVYGFGYRLAD